MIRFLNLALTFPLRSRSSGRSPRRHGSNGPLELEVVDDAGGGEGEAIPHDFFDDVFVDAARSFGADEDTDRLGDADGVGELNLADF